MTLRSFLDMNFLCKKNSAGKSPWFLVVLFFLSFSATSLLAVAATTTPLSLEGATSSQLAAQVTTLGAGLTATPTISKTPGTVLFLGNKNIAPVIYLSPQGDPVGLAVDIVHALAPHISEPIEMRAMDWPTAQSLVAEGQADALVQINATEARKLIYDFSDPLLESHFSIFVNANRLGISGIASLEGLRVGVEKGGLPEQLLSTDSQIALVEIPNFPDAFSQLVSGTLDAVVVDERVGLYVVAQNRIQGVKVAGDPIAPSFSAFAVKKGNAKLLAEINSALQVIKEDGTYQSILEKWQPVSVVFETQEQITQRVLSWIIVVLVALAFVSGVWAVVLRRELTRRAKAERELREASAEVQDLYDQAPCGYHSLNADGLFMRINETELEWLGYKRDELVGKKHFVDIVTEESKKIFRENFPKFKAVGFIRDLEFEMIRKDGSILPILLSGTAIKDEQGNFLMSRSTLYDMTERNREERRIKQLSQRNESILNSAGEGIYGVDSEGNIVFVNSSAAKMLGYDAQEMIGKNSHSLFHHTKADGSPYPIEECPLHESLKIGEVTRGQDEVFWTKKGGRIEVEHVNAPLIEVGRVVGAVVVFGDITERKRTERVLRESEEKYRTLVEKIKVAVVVHGSDTQIITSNPTAEDLLGLSEEQMLGKKAIDPSWRFSREDGTVMPMEEYPVNLVMSSRAPLRDYIVNVHRADGRPDVWALVNADPVFDEQNNITQVIVTFIDITGRKIAEQEIRESEEKFSAAFYSSPDLMSITRVSDGMIMEVNAGYTQMLGYSREESVGKTTSTLSIWADPADRTKFIEMLKNNGQVIDFETKLRRKDGSTVTVIDSARTFDIKGEASILSIAHDITERKLEEDRLKELDKLKDDFLMVTTHELKSPLIPIKSQSQLLLAGDYGDLNQEQKDALVMILRNEEAINELASAVLDISKIKSNKLKLVIEEASLSTLVNDAVADMQNLAQQKHLSLSVSLIPELPTMSVDKLRIKQVLLNLLSNAIKFTPEYGFIRVDVNRREHEVEVRVKDTGIGIEHEDMSKLFIPFSRVESDVTRKYRGTGLGLAISKGIIEQHGGRIWVESEGHDHGSTFAFTLPIK